MAKVMTAQGARGKFTTLCNSLRDARQEATDFAFNNRPLSQEQVAEHRALVAKADAAHDAKEAFYQQYGKPGLDYLRC